MKYKVITKDRKQAVFDEKGKQVSPEWFDYILNEGVLKGESRYYIARKDWKYAVFDVDGKQITPWHDEILPWGLVSGDSDYYIARNVDGEAIFYKDGTQISEWFNYVSRNGLIRNMSDCFIVQNERNKYAIYCLDKESNKANRISGWYLYIYEDGLVRGESKYYLALVEKNGYAIFDKDGNQVSDLLYGIYTTGLVKGESNYYVGQEGEYEALFEVVENKSRMVIPWCNRVDDKFGLVRGQSKYCIVMKDWKQAIFDKDGNRLTEWFDAIYPYGVVNGQAGQDGYFIACRGNTFAVYHITEGKVSKDFPINLLEEGNEASVINFNVNIGIAEIIGRRSGQVKHTVEFKPVSKPTNFFKVRL